MVKGPDKVIDFRSFGDRPAKGLHTSLYIGSKIDAKAEGVLREKNIKYILNCTPTRNIDPEAGCPNFFEGKNPSLSYKRIPIFDNRGEDILQYMEAAIAFIEQGKHYGSVLVHCNKGVSRSASFVLGYLMKTGRLGLIAALEMLKTKRSIVQPNDSFMTQLRTYDVKLEKAREEAAAKDKKHGTGSSHPHHPSSSIATAAQQQQPAPDNVIKGPSRPPPSQAVVSGPSIGPSLPPHLTSTTPAPAADASKPLPAKKGPSIGPSIGPSRPPTPSSPGAAAAPPIGPSGPPPPASSSSSSPSLKRSIGPALPPHLQQQASGEGGKDDGHDAKRPKMTSSSSS